MPFGLNKLMSESYCDNPQSLRRKMASKRRNMFHKNKTQETTEIEISTEDKLEYKFFPVDGKFISFKVKANNDAHVALTTAPSEGSPMYEVFIGGWGNSKYALRKNKEKPELAAVDSANILDSNEYKEFWICWRGGNISLGGSIDDPNPILSWTEPSPFNITHFGVRTGWGATGHWIVDETARPKPRYSWVPTTGSSIPPNALPGGFDNEQILIGRATHKGSVTPGKVIPSHGVCYVSWGGSEHGISEYEVLCNCVGEWVPAADGFVPVGALAGGQSEEGEVLYVGRAKHNDTTTVGKVQASHKVCYIPYGGKEVACQEYEVLVVE